MGPNGLAERLRNASAHVETDASGLATNVPADFVKLLTVAIDSRLAPLYRHVLHKQTQDSHEIFILQQTTTGARIVSEPVRLVNELIVAAQLHARTSEVC